MKVDPDLSKQNKSGFAVIYIRSTALKTIVNDMFRNIRKNNTICVPVFSFFCLKPFRRISPIYSMVFIEFTVVRSIPSPKGTTPSPEMQSKNCF